MFRILGISLFISFCTLNLAKPQSDVFRFRFHYDIPVIENSDTLDFPFAGGVNFGQYGNADLNNDTLPDLIVFDKSNNFFTVLLNQGNKYSYDFDYSPTFPDDTLKPISWVIFRDANCDGFNDIYTMNVSGDGAKILSRLPSFNSFPEWQLFDEKIQFNNDSIFQIINTDIPIIEDIDGDGDIDLASFIFNGSTIKYIRNVSIETTGNCGISEYARETNCWGRIYECITCGHYDINLDSNCQVPGAFCTNRIPLLHGGSASLAMDMDGDNDKDLLVSDFACDEISYLENLGSNTFAQFDSAELGFPFNTTPFNFFVHPAMFYEDVDRDGIKDLMCTPNYTANQSGTLDLGNSSVLYKNTGSNSNPNFVFQNQNHLQDEMIDVGDYSSPALFDYDADGDLDLFIGNRGHNITTSSLQSRLALYENVGDENNPAFVLIDSDYLSLSNLILKSVRPFFEDLNGDGIPDLCFTWFENNGIDYGIHFFPNEDQNGGVVVNPDSLMDYNMGFPTLYSDDFPYFIDVDNDGVKDLINFWSNLGEVRYYRNLGTLANPNFILEKDNVGFLRDGISDHQSSVNILDINGDQKLDMIIGDKFGKIKIYNNIINKIAGSDTLRPITQVIENKFLGRDEYKLNEYLNLAIGDLNNDAKQDLVLGNVTGGIQILYNESIVGLSENESSELTKTIRIYPNPSNGIYNIESEYSGYLRVYNLIGKLILESSYRSEIDKLDLSFFENGLYIIEFETTLGTRSTQRLIKQ